MVLEFMTPYFELATQLVTIMGVPIAIYVYLREQKEQRVEREYGTYNALDDKYIELQQLCLQYPELDIFDTPKQKTHALSEEQLKQEEAILLIRISIFERAYLMYQEHKNIIKKSQWNGWLLEMVEWMQRENFRRIWEEQSQYFDLNFKAFLEGETEKHLAVSDLNPDRTE